MTPNALKFGEPAVREDDNNTPELEIVNLDRTTEEEVDVELDCPLEFE
jgi:hypothetical protein